MVRVHPEILRAQNLPENLLEGDRIWEKRYRSIVDLEKHLHRNGTRIIKFFLHLSKEEQRKRFLARIEDPAKNWKFSRSDIAERKFWKDYVKAYEACLGATSTEHAPWHVVPADDKENARLDHFPSHPRHAQGVEDELSPAGPGAAEGIAIAPQAAGEIEPPIVMPVLIATANPREPVILAIFAITYIGIAMGISPD